MLKTLLFVILLLCFTTTVTSQDSQPSVSICRKARLITLENIRNTGSKQWWDDPFKSVYYAPIGSRDAYEKYKKLVQNKSLTSDDEINEACFQGRFENNTRTEMAFGIDYIANCYYDISDHTVRRCERKGYNSTYIVTWSKYYSTLAVYCEDQSRPYWLVYSEYSELSEDEKENILKNVQDLGFDINNTRSSSYKNCNLAFTTTTESLFKVLEDGSSTETSDAEPEWSTSPGSVSIAESSSFAASWWTTEPFAAGTEWSTLPDAVPVGDHSSSTVAAGRNSISESPDGICSKAKQLGRTKYVTDLADGYYAPLGSIDAYEKYMIMYEGRSLNSDDDINEACIRGYVDGREKAFGNETMVQCSVEDDNTFICMRNGQTTKFMTIWGSENSSVTVHCDDESRPYWLVLSKNPVISEEEKEKILQYVHDIGFDASRTRLVNYNNCNLASTPTGLAANTIESMYNSTTEGSSMTSSQAPGRVAVEENSQPNASDICNKTEMNGLGQVSEGFTDKFYVPIGSRNAYDAYKLRFKGSSLASDDEINDACIQGHTEGLNPRIEKAFGVEQTFTCAPEPNNKFSTKCEGGNNSYKYFAAGTDSRRNYLIAVFCEDKSRPYWVAYSYNKTISDEGKENILQKVRFLGFDDKKDTRLSSYDKCE